ncbi:hypothetical protein C6A85_29615 [Mycobacterium sp. ITM-2017-0098]|nr:hypothetical protein C6A85_58890 [Mycobacterium sp. ITM-2017-0098]PRC58216.1 hypothetical protein C6A85_29615 [Mycobacterium sp. ITM-2017-0098]
MFTPIFIEWNRTDHSAAGDLFNRGLVLDGVIEYVSEEGQADAQEHPQQKAQRDISGSFRHYWVSRD